MNLIDNAKHQGKRKKLISALKSMDIESEKVLKAMLKVPRHYFLDSSFEDFAYQNKAFPIGTEQTISHPYTVAFQSEVLNIKLALMKRFSSESKRFHFPHFAGHTHRKNPERCNFPLVLKNFS